MSLILLRSSRCEPVLILDLFPYRHPFLPGLRGTRKDVLRLLNCESGQLPDFGYPTSLLW